MEKIESTHNQTRKRRKSSSGRTVFISNHSNVYFRNHLPLWDNFENFKAIQTTKQKINRIFGYNLKKEILREYISNIKSKKMLARLEILFYKCRFVRFSESAQFRRNCVTWLESCIEDYGIPTEVIKLTLKIFDKIRSNIDLILIREFILNQILRHMKTTGIEISSDLISLSHSLEAFFASFKLKKKHKKRLIVNLFEEKEWVMRLNVCFLIAVKKIVPSSDNVLCKVKQVKTFVEMERFTDCQKFSQTFGNVYLESDKIIPEIVDLEKWILDLTKEYTNNF